LSDYSFLEGKKILVTGATGLIGKAIISELLLHGGIKPVKVVALVRDEIKARRRFADLPVENLEYLVTDICDLQATDMGVDYIIHGANHTASKSFVEQPVDVILCAIKGTQNILNFAKANNVRSAVYLSTMEVYGFPQTEDKIYENSPAFLDSTSVRSSYPESKRLCENMCAAYCSQYNVSVKIVRLTQTFGEGVSYDDKRVFAEFARCAIENKDIVLKTKGETKRNYLYVNDAVKAILTVLEKGEVGHAYNAANEQTYCSIYEMAQMVAEDICRGGIKVRIESDEAADNGYAPVLKMNLSAEKLKNLGWTPSANLRTAFEKLIAYMKNNRS
jgi:nucleoside-diphosphate-sugar epimerase